MRASGQRDAPFAGGGAISWDCEQGDASILTAQVPSLPDMAEIGTRLALMLISIKHTERLSHGDPLTTHWVCHA